MSHYLLYWQPPQLDKGKVIFAFFFLVIQMGGLPVFINNKMNNYHRDYDFVNGII